MPKRARRIVVLSLAGIVLLAGGALLFVHTSIFQQWLLRRVENGVAAAGYRVTAERLRFNIWRLQASLEKAVYEDGKTTSVTADRLLVAIPWNAFRGDLIRIKDLQADGIAIDIRSVDVAAHSAKTIEIPRITFDRLAIRNGSLTYSDRTTTVRIPSFEIETENGRGALHFGSPITISPNIRLAVPDVALQMSDHTLDFGPWKWQLNHPDITVAVSSRGHLQWSPALAGNFDYSTDPFSYQTWRNLESSASIGYENGVVKVMDFHARSAAGMADGSAEITDQSKSINLLWRAVNLDPAGFPATTDGNLQLQWQAADLNDLSGSGSILVNSRQYGRSQSNVTIRNARANLEVRATVLDTSVRANVATGWDQTLSGTFQATNTRYGSARLEGTLGGSLRDPRMNAKLTASGVMYNGIGPVQASADTSLRSRVVVIDDIQAQLRNSMVPRGSLRIDLNSERVTGEIPEIHVRLADFAPNVDGNATLSVLVEGTVQKPTARIAGSSDSSNISGTHLESIKLTGEVDTNRLLVTDLTAQQREGTFSAMGSYSFDSEAIGGSVHISNLQIDEIQEASAIASVTANIGGTIHTPEANFSGRLLNVSYRNQQHGNLDFDGRIQNDVASLRLRSDKYTAQGTAEIQLTQPYAYKASLTANRSHVDYQQYGFTASGEVHASGELKPFSAERIGFEDLSLQGEGIDLRASGSLPEGANVTATADLSKLPAEKVQAAGQTRLQAIVSGTIKNPRVEGSLETSDATVLAAGMTEPADIQAAIDFTRNEFTIRRLHTDFAGATADIGGRGTLEGSGHFQFSAAGIRVERFLKDRPVSGVVGLEGEVNVAEPSIEGISGSAKVNQFELIVNNIPIHQVQPIEVRFENQTLTTRNVLLEGLDTRATITGSANLRTRALDFKMDGGTDLKLLEAVLPGSNPSGQIKTSVTVAGTLEHPDVEGSVSVANMQLQISDPPVFVTDTNAEIQLRPDRIQIVSASGKANGGKFTASGGAGISPAGLENTAIQLNLVGAQTEYPEGFESEISSRLSMNGSGTNLEISGNVDVLSGVYRRDIDLTHEVFSRVTASPAVTASATPRVPTAMEQIQLNVTVATPGVVSVTNNVANFEMEGSFRLRGTVGDPILTGRAGVAEGGEIYFGPQVGVASATQLDRRDKYVVSEGSINFTNPTRTEPNFNFVATHELQAKDERYTITLRASGTLDNFKTELTSDPYLDEPNIVAMLLTGRTLDDLQGNELLVAQEQAANYLSGRFGNLFQTAGSTFGLTTVRIDPVLVAQDEDLSAKLTIGKDITSNFGLIYSQNLSGPRAQTWIASYQPLKNLLIRGVNQSDDNNLTVELRHDLKWGGGPPLPKAPKRQGEKTLGKITFEGTTVPMRDLLKQVTKTGKPFDAYRMNEDVRKLRQFYADLDFLAAKIRAVRNPGDGTVDVDFVVDEGPAITFVFEGAKVPKGIQEEIRQVWIRGFDEASSLRRSQDRLLRYLRDEGYLQAKLSARDESPSDTTRRFVFDISPGRQFEDPRWVFKGIEPIDLKVTPGVVLEDTKAIQDRIQNALWRDGYLNASCTEPQLIIDGRAARFEIAVERGPRFSIGKVTANETEALRFLPPGEEGQKAGEGMFTSAWLERARQSVIGSYWAKGFNDVQVTAETRVPKVGTTVDVAFKIDPGKQQLINRIEIDGNKTTNLEYVRRQFTFKEGDPVDYSRINQTRKQLYDTRLFRRVDLKVTDGAGGYVARTTLNEKPPWNFRYGFAVTDQLQTSDRQFGATADLTYANLLGKAITTGTSMKYTPDTHEVRVFGSLPVLFGKNVITTGAVFRTRDLTIPESITDLWGFTVQQQWKLRNRYLLSYDYSYKRNHTIDKNFDPEDPFAFNVTIPIARFNGTLSGDTRDDILNATKGSFWSNSFEIAPPGVGSSIQFLRNFSQYLRFEPVKKRLVWASALRVGVAHGFHDQELIPTERFRAGGGTTLRGFQQDQLATPGNGLFIVNQELRFPLFWRFSGVSFLDGGNVYSALGSFNPLRLRYSPGAGIRVQTPLVLIRFDMGFNVVPLPGEPRYRFAFGVGQAF